MNSRLVKTSLLATLFALSQSYTGCGFLDQLTSKADSDGVSESQANESDTSNLMEESLSAASGSSEPSLRHFRMDGMEVGHGPQKGGKHGKGHGRRPGKGHGVGKRHGAEIPAELQALMKSADAKKDSVLGIDRAKVDEILNSMKTDLETLRAVAVSREDFKAQAKVVQDKYADQLRAALPAFDSLTQEQKDRVKALHDLQKGVFESCVKNSADSASAACTAAKSALQANIDAP